MPASNKKAPAAVTAKAADEKAVAVKETAAKVEKVEKVATVTKEKAPAAPKEKKAAAPKEKKTAAKEKAPAAKRTARRATTAKAEKTAADAKTTVFVEYQGRQVSLDDILGAVKHDWGASGQKPTALKSLSLYVKPEDSTVYYVANGKVSGKVNF